MNMDEEKDVVLPIKKTSPFRADGVRDLGPNGIPTPAELRDDEIKSNNERMVNGQGLYNRDHPGC